MNTKKLYERKNARRNKKIVLQLSQDYFDPLHSIEKEMMIDDFSELILTLI
jgi:hypothetical protein